MNFIKKNILVFAGILLGAVVGYLYWKYVGCITGSCAITSNPTSSTLYGSAIGGLLFSLIKPQQKKS
jgi:phage shock protein E